MVTQVPKMPKLEIFIFHPVTGAGSPRPNREPSPRRTNYEKVLKIQILERFYVSHGPVLNLPKLFGPIPSEVGELDMQSRAPGETCDHATTRYLKISPTLAGT